MTLCSGHSILLVDDEHSIIRSLQRLFRKDNYRVLTASSGQEGLEMLSALDKPVSLIISDQRMPGMSGRPVSGESQNPGSGCHPVSPDRLFGCQGHSGCRQ